MKQKLDLEEIKHKIFKKLEPSGWGRVLKLFIFSSDFDNIIKQLVKHANDGKRFTPTLKDIFKAFEECPYDKLKIVVIGQDPYPQINIADGIAFSCSKTGDLQTSLKYMLEEVNRTVYNGERTSTNPDLTRWSNQGILMLNTALTTTIGKIGQHYQIWRPFIAYLFDYLTWYNNGLIYIYMGKEAQIWSEAVNDNNYKFMVPHPASAAYQKLQLWDSNDVFNKVNKILLTNNNEQIVW